MAFEIPANLDPSLMPLAWLIGHWEGRGHGSWPGAGDFEFGQQMDFHNNTGPYLHYILQTFTLDDEGNPQAPLFTETGYWRGTGSGVELVIANPGGWAEIWAGEASGGKIELTTDVVARTTTAELEYTGGHRLYGNVESDLMWAFDRASADVEMQPYLWGRLKRV